MTIPLSNNWFRRFGVHGPPFDYAALEEPHEALYREPLEIADDLLARRIGDVGGVSDVRGESARKNGSSLSAAFYTSGAFNAHAASEGNEALVAISAFVPPVVFSACSAVAGGLDGDTGDALLRGGKLPVCEDPASWVASRPRPPESPDEWVKAFTYPADITSKQFDWAMRLYAIAMRFLVAHECMHVLLGHTGWLSARYGCHDLLEFGAVGGAGRMPLRDIIEFQADYNAAVSVTRGLLRGPTVQHLRTTLGLADDRAAIRQLLRCTVRAFVILTRCFPEPDVDPFSRQPMHPHPYVRSRSIVLCALAAAQELLETGVGHRSDVLPAYAETVALLETRTRIGTSWREWMESDTSRAQRGERYSEDLHFWRQRHARRAANYFYQWAPRFQLHDGTTWEPPADRRM